MQLLNKRKLFGCWTYLDKALKVQIMVFIYKMDKMKLSVFLVVTRIEVPNLTAYQ